MISQGSQLTDNDEAAGSAPSPGGEELVLPLHAEAVQLSRRTVERAVVRVATVTHERPQLVEETLRHERVEIERVPVGRIVEVAPAVREEGDVTILPVIEEIVVIERRLFLKEEVHVRRVRSSEPYRQTVLLRQQEAVVTREPTPRADPADAPIPHRTAPGPSTSG